MADTVKHSELTGQENHAIHVWEYADAAAREAATGFTASDEKKLALQLDDMSYYVLAAASPVEWVAVGGASGAASPAMHPPQYLQSSNVGMGASHIMHGYDPVNNVMVPLELFSARLNFSFNGARGISITAVGIMEPGGSTFVPYGMPYGAWLRGSNQEDLANAMFDATEQYTLLDDGEGARLLFSTHLYYRDEMNSVNPPPDVYYVLAVTYAGDLPNEFQSAEVTVAPDLRSFTLDANGLTEDYTYVEALQVLGVAPGVNQDEYYLIIGTEPQV